LPIEGKEKREYEISTINIDVNICFHPVNYTEEMDDHKNNTLIYIENKSIHTNLY